MATHPFAMSEPGRYEGQVECRGTWLLAAVSSSVARAKSVIRLGLMDFSLRSNQEQLLDTCLFVLLLFGLF